MPLLNCSFYFQTKIPTCNVRTSAFEQYAAFVVNVLRTGQRLCVECLEVPIARPRSLHYVNRLGNVTINDVTNQWHNNLTTIINTL